MQIRLAHLQLSSNLMSKLTEIKKKIAALEAEAERIAKQEMSGAVAKIRSLMSDFGITLEHLSGRSTPAAAKRAASRKVASKKRAGVGVARYADPKTGKTWTGFGRAPAWIAEAKNRDAFLIGSMVAEPDAVAPAKRAKKKTAASAAPAAAAKEVAKAAKAAKKVAKKAPKKVAAVATKARATKKLAVARKVASESPATPAAAKKVARKVPKKTPAKASTKAAKKVAGSKKAGSTSAPVAAASEAAVTATE